MNFSLGNGRVINIPPAMILNLSDQEFDDEINELLCRNLGFETNDIWDNSVLTNGEAARQKKSIDVDSIPLDDIIDNDFLDIVFFFEED